MLSYLLCVSSNKYTYFITSTVCLFLKLIYLKGLIVFGASKRDLQNAPKI